MRSEGKCVFPTYPSGLRNKLKVFALEIARPSIGSQLRNGDLLLPEELTSFHCYALSSPIFPSAGHGIDSLFSDAAALLPILAPGMPAIHLCITPHKRTAQQAAMLSVLPDPNYLARRRTEPGALLDPVPQLSRGPPKRLPTSPILSLLPGTARNRPQPGPFRPAGRRYKFSCFSTRP